MDKLINKHNMLQKINVAHDSLSLNVTMKLLKIFNLVLTIDFAQALDTDNKCIQDANDKHNKIIQNQIKINLFDNDQFALHSRVPDAIDRWIFLKLVL